MPQSSKLKSSSGLHRTAGRGAVSNRVNRFQAIHSEDEIEHLCAADDSPLRPKLPTTYLIDQTETIVSENTSPDLGFRFNLNPCRGCSRGCSYCYAKPSHEYSADFQDFQGEVWARSRASCFTPRPFRRPNLSGPTELF